MHGVSLSKSPRKVVDSKRTGCRFHAKGTIARLDGALKRGSGFSSRRCFLPLTQAERRRPSLSGAKTARPAFRGAALGAPGLMTRLGGLWLDETSELLADLSLLDRKRRGRENPPAASAKLVVEVLETIFDRDTGEKFQAYTISTAMEVNFLPSFPGALPALHLLDRINGLRPTGRETLVQGSTLGNAPLPRSSPGGATEGVAGGFCRTFSKSNPAGRACRRDALGGLDRDLTVTQALPHCHLVKGGRPGVAFVPEGRLRLGRD